MCGRTACTLDPDGLCKACSYGTGKGGIQKPVWREDPGGHQYYPSYNIAPGAYTPVLLSSSHFPGELAQVCNRVIQPMRWGLVPSWYKGDPKKVSYDTNNCRAEGMLEKPTYKVPLQKGRRCVVLADGFFEWKRDNNQKQPYFIYFPRTNHVKKEPCEETQHFSHGSNSGTFDGLKEECLPIRIKEEIKEEGYSEENLSPNKSFDTVSNADGKSDVKIEMDSSEEDTSGKPLLYMAGVFDLWTSQDGEILYSYSVITVAASPVMSWIHHRMPAILTSEEEVNHWIDYGTIPISQVLIEQLLARGSNSDGAKINLQPLVEAKFYILRKQIAKSNVDLKAVKYIRSVTSLQMHPVSSMVNNSRCKAPECVQPIDLKDIKSGSAKTSSPISKGSSQMMMKWLSTGKNQQMSSSPNMQSVKKSPTKLNKSQNLMMGWLSRGKRKSSEEEQESKKAKT